MTKTDYRNALVELGLSQVSAARFLEIGERTSRRMASGEIEVPVEIEMLLNIMVDKHITPEQALAKYANTRARDRRVRERRERAYERREAEFAELRKQRRAKR